MLDIEESHISSKYLNRIDMEDLFAPMSYSYQILVN